MVIEELSSAEEAGRLAPGQVQPVDVATYGAASPLRHLAALDGERRLLARCSIWRGSDSRGVPTSTGLIGHFAAGDSDEGAGPSSAGAAVLDHACRLLGSLGCNRAVGPMDGSTWRSYRLVTEQGTEPPFFLEPENPERWPRLFEEQGFEPLATYTSALADDLGRTNPRTPERLEALTDAGIRFRTLRQTELPAELVRLYDLSVVAFADNFLYSPIDSRSFTDMYLPLEPFLVPEIVHLAERDGILVGYCFALPDLLGAKRGDKRKTMIVKTVAIDPAHAGAGLGSVLVDLCQQAGHRLGFERAIHALMHETNRSRAISQKYGSTIRRYTLYARDLGS